MPWFLLVMLTPSHHTTPHHTTASPAPASSDRSEHCGDQRETGPGTDEACDGDTGPCQDPDRCHPIMEYLETEIFSVNKTVRAGNNNNNNDIRGKNLMMIKWSGMII